MITTHMILWMILVVGFLVVEACTAALVCIWFSAGAAAALLLGWLGLPFWAQVAAFLVVSAGLVILLRPVLRRRAAATKTNVDSVIGTLGIVTEDIDNIAYTGQVKLGAMTWSARSTGGAVIPKGTTVRADRIEGVKVFVSPAEVAETL